MVNDVLIIISKAVPLRLYTSGVSSIRVLASIIIPLMGGSLSDSRLAWRWYVFPTLVAGTYTNTVLVVLYQLALRSRRRMVFFFYIDRL
jgi:hypothetical protein